MTQSKNRVSSTEAAERNAQTAEQALQRFKNTPGFGIFVKHQDGFDTSFKDSVEYALHGQEPVAPFYNKHSSTGKEIDHGALAYAFIKALPGESYVDIGGIDLDELPGRKDLLIQELNQRLQRGDEITVRLSLPQLLGSKFDFHPAYGLSLVDGRLSARFISIAFRENEEEVAE